MGRGQWVEGFTGTTIKDTWAKSRGRVEVGEGGGFGWGGVERWGENADNCNRKTKIKKKRAVLLGLLFKLPYLHLTKMSVRETLLSPFLQ